MKKTLKYYSIIWGIVLILFNVISFVPAENLGVERYTASFWIGYVFITLSFIGQYVCTYFALKDGLNKTFYRLSLISTSYTGLILSFVFGGLCMLISVIPYWISVILCAVVLTFNVITVAMAATASEIVSGIDEKIKTKTFFIKSLTVDAEDLIARAKSQDAKSACKKVYEAVRYSDPMSNDALSSVENEITYKMSKLQAAVMSDDSGSVSSTADEILILLANRNSKCKLLK